ncbi:MAG TPA: glutathione peroxidase [Candidatus Dormibacteraeota bacterium]
MPIPSLQLKTLDGLPLNLDSYRGRVLLIVNVASQCGFTPQYAPLQTLFETYRQRGFAVLGFPCNQFGGQEPGSAGEIQSFCETQFGVTFPLFEKVEVNGEGRHPLFAELTAFPDADGYSGDVRWNFEKWIVAPDGEVVARFSTLVSPDDPAIAAEIEKQLTRVIA